MLYGMRMHMSIMNGLTLLSTNNQHKKAHMMFSL